MKTLLALPLLISCVQAQPTPAGTTATAERHEFVIENFRTASGVTLPKARIVYGTYGHLNADKSNAVLLPSHYMANLRGYEWLIGADRALDPSRLFLVTSSSQTEARLRRAIRPSRFTVLDFP